MVPKHPFFQSSKMKSSSMLGAENSGYLMRQEEGRNVLIVLNKENGLSPDSCLTCQILLGEVSPCPRFTNPCSHR